MQSELLLIFVKHPIPGQVKTRLAASLGHEKALSIYQRLLAHTRDLSSQLSADKVVFYGNEVPEQDLWQEAGYPRFLQSGEDLGARMKHAFQWGLGQGYERILIIGSDCAELEAVHLQEAFLQLKEYDAILGPAKDGGYYCLGMKQLIPTLFEKKDWSTASVFTASIQDLLRENRAFYLLPTLSDIDHEADLEGTFLAE